MSSRVWIVMVVLSAALGGLLATRVLRWVARVRLAWRRRRGQRGEQQAPAVLAAAGYRVVEQQPHRATELAVDGEGRPYHVRADFLAARGDERFVVEVKTGTKAPNPRHSATRRQLLEYRVLYAVDGVLLVDMEAERVHRITWPELQSPGRRPGGGAWLWGLMVGLLVGAILGWFAAR